MTLQPNLWLALRLHDGRSVKIVLREVALDKLYPYERTLLWGADEGSPPKAVVVSIDVSVNGTHVDVPLSAYADLADLKQAMLTEKSEGFALHLDGGDTGTHYTVELSFRRGCIVSRIVRLSEFPETDWEQSYYSKVNGDDSTRACGATATHNEARRRR